jgi:hypothetical protein
MAQLVKNPIELFHSRAWASSIRAASGQFARYPSGRPIFPGDFVYFTCAKRGACYCTGVNRRAEPEPHLGQVMAVWEDRRHLDELGRHRGPTKVEIQRFYHGSEIYDIPIDTRDPPLTDGEILMAWGKLHLVDEFAIIERVHNIMVDYNFDL